MEPLADFAQLELHFVDQVQWRYEVIRPLVLFDDRTAVQRAVETDTHPETVRKLTRRFRRQGILGLFPDQTEMVMPSRGQQVPSEVIEELARLKALYEGFQFRELARIIHYRCNYHNEFPRSKLRGINPPLAYSSGPPVWRGRAGISCVCFPANLRTTPAGRPGDAVAYSLWHCPVVLHMLQKPKQASRNLTQEIDDKTVKKLWQQSPGPVQGELPLGTYHSHPQRYDARLQLIKLYYQGWNKLSISRFLKVSRPTIDLWIRRFEAEHFAGLEDKSHTPHSTPRKVWFPLMVEVYHLQKRHPDAGRFRIWSLLAREDLW